MGTEVSQTSQELCTSTAYNDRPGTRPYGSSRRANNGNGKGGMTLAGSVSSVSTACPLSWGGSARTDGGGNQVVKI
ncbi:hypothetical protein B0T13DRAFT_237736 [Neurospora crassa]|nr:hypothetical protein B0T13DRAFT_237736 [Neurospora crassa]